MCVKEQCSTCSGTGRVIVTRTYGPNNETTKERCNSCDGSGKVDPGCSYGQDYSTGGGLFSGERKWWRKCTKCGKVIRAGYGYNEEDPGFYH